MIRIAIPNTIMYVCLCNSVTDREIRQAVDLGATSFHDLREGLGIAANCGKCDACARDILREALAGSHGGGLALASGA